MSFNINSLNWIKIPYYQNMSDAYTVALSYMRMNNFIKD